VDHPGGVIATAANLIAFQSVIAVTRLAFASLMDRL